MSNNRNEGRSGRLSRFFGQVLSGKQTVSSTNNAKLFLEAIPNEPDAAVCIQKLMSHSGFSALQSALRCDISYSFINGPVAAFLVYLQDPRLKSICGGDVLRQIISAVVGQPLFWNAFVQAAVTNHLSEEGDDGFSWLLHQLLSLPMEQALLYTMVVPKTYIQDRLYRSPKSHVRSRGYRIRHIIETMTANHQPEIDGPGGRNDNDFGDIRKISILPTPDELNSREPFLRRAAEMDEAMSKSPNIALHIDNQFRLLREDMLRDLRQEIQVALTLPKKKNRRGRQLDHLSLARIITDEHREWSLGFQCLEDLPEFKNKDSSARQKILKENSNFFKHESVTCVIADGDLLAMGVLIRDIDLLSESPAILCLQISEAAIPRVLMRSKTAKKLGLVQLSTAIFSHEPVLKQLKEIRELSLEDAILYKDASGAKAVQGAPSYNLSSTISDFVNRLRGDHTLDLQEALGLPKSTRLDESQAASFLAGLNQRLSVIQGPPGTGKSFIGSLVLKAIYAHSSQIMLVVCYTHHALDQFLEDAMDLGVPDSDIVRLGSAAKASARVKHLSMNDLRFGSKLNRDQWFVLRELEQSIRDEGNVLQSAFKDFQEAQANKNELLEHLAFGSEDLPFDEAFQVPTEEDNMVRIGKKGKAIDTFYLIDRWCRGKDAGIYKKPIGMKFPQVWEMRPDERMQKLDRWKTEILEERVDRICELGTAYNNTLDRAASVRMEKDLGVMRDKRIIACTTTAAAKYVKAIQSVAPGVVIVEEAGEILESHILTALGPETKQLVLIGDHKQLRPKVHYDLSVEKRDGYDLNRSLFERLVIKGYPHHVLLQQHRMRPEISAFSRKLTYPDLVDAADTHGRADLKGLQSNVIFVNHHEPEAEMPNVPDWKDFASSSSRRNVFEAEMTLKCVRYLGQQGYGTDKLVVLTPYLGQLRLLLDVLRTLNDPVLNDLDSYDLVRAGLMPAATASMQKPKIRISTIDNYQGEESDIVIVSLTRSNTRGDIGFMSVSERLNVMITRSRDGLIIIGNAETFLESRKGKENWGIFIDMLKKGCHIYDGLPVKCQRHPNRTALLECPQDFDEKCADGGCSEPCGITLNCGIHKCPSRCHQLYDHSKMACENVVASKCTKGHIQKWKCHENKTTVCLECQREDEEQRQKLQEDLAAQARRDKAQSEHSAKLAKIEQEIRRARDQTTEERLEKERETAIAQKQRDLEAALKQAQQHKIRIEESKKSSDPNGPVKNISPPKSANSPTKTEQASSKPSEKIEIQKTASEVEWERQKKVDGSSNDAIDALMSMTGLEDVKAKVLSIKAKIETTKRQGTDMKQERLGLVLLGNPGTGKTTVARLYARFLESVGALPGSEFIETTGSRLANEGVQGATKKIEQIDKAGGGVFFIDEAYQLADGQSPGGAAVCQFLLAEIENRRGKIVFILAGYNKPMEKFFETNEGFESRMPHRLHFADYTDQELSRMLRSSVEKRYSGNAELEGGFNGLYARIAIRRLGRGRGREGYGNARALENLWSRVTERQSDRLQRERASGAKPNDFFFSKEDLIGPEPAEALKECAAWKELQGLIGLQAVKDAVRALIERIQLNYHRELAEKPPIEVSLNRVFLGSPGTGKTSVGKLYASILADLGLLSKREVVIKNPSDFVGSVLGESEKNTKAILKATEGKVLLIDEAYMLHGGGKGPGNSADIYRTAVIDTIVAEVQSTPGEDRCVLLLGYDEQMKEMLDNANPGLARRFPLSSAFHFDDFDNSQLRQILDLKLAKQGLEATEDAKRVAIEVLARKRDLPNFGNAGEVENMISHAKEQEQRRSMPGSFNQSGDVLFLPQDFDENFDRAKDSAVNCQKLFADVVGCDEIIRQFQSYQEIAVKAKAQNRDPRKHVPFNFIFKGPPGTGKTTTARKVGQLYYDMGLLSTADYEEISATDLVAPYEGQTGAKTVEALRRALGKVLFVDEAYRLCEGAFGHVAIGQLVDSLTKPQFSGKLVVILAGYSKDMDRLLQVNQGLSRRFPNEVVFRNMKPEECLTLLKMQLENEEIEVLLPGRDSQANKDIMAIFGELSTLPSWGNGGDVKTLSERIGSTAIRQGTSSVTEKEIISALKEMLKTQKSRSKVVLDPGNSSKILTQQLNPATGVHSNKAALGSVATKTKETSLEPESEHDESTTIHEGTQRDAGVSDEIWKQLQADIQANELAEKQISESLQEMERSTQSLHDKEQTTEQQNKALEEALELAMDDDEEDELRRQQEEARLKALAINRARQEAEEKLRLARLEQERQRRVEVQAQKKLREMGVCPVGYRWIKQGSGYRCAGGSHFVSNSQIGV